MPSDLRRAADFFDSLYDPKAAAYSFSAGARPGLYGTCFALMGRHYLGAAEPEEIPRIGEFIKDCQQPESGFFAGPDLEGHFPAPDAQFQRDYIQWHLTCHVLPVADLFDLEIGPLLDMRRYLDLGELRAWLDARDLSDAWQQGNNFLFMGQMLWHMRERERAPGAAEALDLWFRWLDENVDPETGLWGSDRPDCSNFTAMCGGYHQLVAYNFEQRKVSYPERLIDTVLDLQHPDGGFVPWGGGGACEDVDAVDILVNMYKLVDYRRGDIRAALRRTLRQIVATQNADGGFPYHQHNPFIYMGLPITSVEPNKSHAFGTWFRVHTLALIAEVIDDPVLEGIDFQFNSALSMGWHRKWPTEEKAAAARSGSETAFARRQNVRLAALKARRVLGAVKRRIRRPLT